MCLCVCLNCLNTAIGEDIHVCVCVCLNCLNTAIGEDINVCVCMYFVLVQLSEDMYVLCVCNRMSTCVLKAWDTAPSCTKAPGNWKLGASLCVCMCAWRCVCMYADGCVLHIWVRMWTGGGSIHAILQNINHNCEQNHKCEHTDCEYEHPD